MTFSEELIEGAREQARLIDGLLASGDVDNDLNADEQERAELTMRFSSIAAEAMNALNTMEREAEAREKWEKRQKGTARGAIIKALDPETRDKLYHMADAWKETPAAALDEAINVLYSLMETTGAFNNPSGALAWDNAIEKDGPEPIWEGGFIFEETDKPITPGNVLGLLELDLNNAKIIKTAARHNPDRGLFGPGHGKGEELIIAAAIEDTLDNRRGAFIFWVSEDTRNGKHGFWRKETAESMGPAIFAPPAILDLLTPTEDPDALEWRKDSRDFYSREGTEERYWDA